MAHDAIAFLSAVEFDQVDLLGFSIGSFVAQEMCLIRPSLVRKLILASTAPQGAAGMHGWAADVIGAVGQRETNAEGVLDVFYTRSPANRQAGEQALQRMFARTTDRDLPTSWETRQAQYDAVCAWGIPNHSLLQRVSAIRLPVFVANGDSDPMIRPHFSHLLAGLVPQTTVRSTRTRPMDFSSSTTRPSRPTSRLSSATPPRLGRGLAGASASLSGGHRVRGADDNAVQGQRPHTLAPPCRHPSRTHGRKQQGPDATVATASYVSHSMLHRQVPGFEPGAHQREVEGPHHPRLRGAGEAGVMGAVASVIGASAPLAMDGSPGGEKSARPEGIVGSDGAGRGLARRGAGVGGASLVRPGRKWWRPARSTPPR